MNNQGYEYRIFSVHADEFLTGLNRLGAEHWRLVSIENRYAKQLGHRVIEVLMVRHRGAGKGTAAQEKAPGGTAGKDYPPGIKGDVALETAYIMNNGTPDKEKQP